MRLRQSATKSPRNAKRLSCVFSFPFDPNPASATSIDTPVVGCPDHLKKTLTAIQLQRYPSSTNFIYTRHKYSSACHRNSFGQCPHVQPIRASPSPGRENTQTLLGGFGQQQRLVGRSLSPVTGRRVGRSGLTHRSTYPSPTPVGGFGPVRSTLLSVAQSWWPCTHPDRPTREPAAVFPPTLLASTARHPYFPPLCDNQREIVVVNAVPPAFLAIVLRFTPALPVGILRFAPLGAFE
jgi:hypothetical protein